jgi:AP-1-like factor
MSMELREYRKRLSLTGGLGRTPSLNSTIPPYLAGKGLSSVAVNNPNDVSFQFEFPRFGRLPGPSPSTSANLNGARNSLSPSVVTKQIPTSTEKDQVSPRDQSLQLSLTGSSNAGLTQSPIHRDDGDMSSLSGLFSPSLLESVAKSPPFEYFANNKKSNTNGSRSSTDSTTGNTSTGHNTTYSSPSASSSSNHGPSSSCGTSPEPTMQSPNFGKAADPTLTTIGEEHSGATGEGELTFCDKLNMACGNPNNPVPRTMSESGVNSGNFDNPAFDINGIDWFAQQNGNQFDPQLFGDYREPQENILAGDAFTDNFFSEAYALPDFNSPFNMEPSPVPPKKDLVQQIDEKQDEEEEVVPGEDRSQLLNCNTIWYAFKRVPSA